MKILGHSKIKPVTESVEIGIGEDGKPVFVLLTGPSLGSVEAVNEELPSPSPPQIVVRGKDGQALKDEEGRTVTLPNYDDGDYIKRLDRINRAKSMAVILQCMGEQVELEAKRNGNPVEYYEAVFKELGEFGIGLTAWKRLSHAALRVSGMADEEVAAARAELVEALPEGG